MKKFSTFLAAALLTVNVFAQTPEKMSYQAVVRNSSDQLVTNKAIGMQISILQGAASGAAVYVETHIPTTNSNGLVSIEVGTGTTSDDFSAIDWTNGPYFIQTAIDPTGGIDYSITGTSQLLSVPYALHAKTAEIASGIITNYYQFANLNWNSVTVDNSWTALAISPTNEVTFIKEQDDTKIEVYFNSRVHGGTFADDSNMHGVHFNITINNMFPTYGTQGSIVSSNTKEFISFFSVFDNLPAGSHNLRIVARASQIYSLGVHVDPGGWFGGLILKEVW